MPRQRRRSEVFDVLVGAKFRELRDQRGLSLRQVAEGSNLGITKSGLSAIEHGTQQLTTFQFFLITRFFKLSPSELFKQLEKEVPSEEFDGASQISDVEFVPRKGGESIKIEDL